MSATLNNCKQIDLHVRGLITFYKEITLTNMNKIWKITSGVYLLCHLDDIL